MRDDSGHGGHRHARLEGLILDELRSLLRDDVGDPALDGVRLVAISLSVDMRHARIHFTTTKDADAPPSNRQALLRAFERVTPFLRRELAATVEMKRIPDLRFVFDGEAA